MRGLVGRRLGGGSNAAASGVRLVQPGAFAGGGLVTFSRAQVASIATATNPAGNVVEFAADAPRFSGSAQRLLLGGQRTNSNPNPRAVGSTATSIPTGWSFSNTRGITYSYSRATVNGVEGTVVRGAGTPNSTSGATIALEIGETLAAGLAVVNSLYIPWETFLLRYIS